MSTLALVVATLGLAWCQFIAAFFVDILGIGDGDWSEERQKAVSTSTPLFRAALELDNF